VNAASVTAGNDSIFAIKTVDGGVAWGSGGTKPAGVPAPAPEKVLPRTGPHDRLLLLGAGAALAVGGLAWGAGTRRRRAEVR